MTSSKWEKHRREAVLDRLTSFAEELKRMRHRQWQIAVETAALQEELTPFSENIHRRRTRQSPRRSPRGALVGVRSLTLLAHRTLFP